MLWLASFPRSGNTFFRNILYDVYSIESESFNKEFTDTAREKFKHFRVVKTHLLPAELSREDPQIRSVYLVRDGRDSLISMAHQRKDILNPNSDFYLNLKEAIVAAEGTFFGGWSKNVQAWVEKADIIIRFEDLIKNPIREVEKLRSIMDLPEANLQNIPSFESQKTGMPKYGSERDLNVSESYKREFANKFFRSGKVGGWKNEMPLDLQKLFWLFHGNVMQQLGYQEDGSISNFEIKPNSVKTDHKKYHEIQKWVAVKKLEIKNKFFGR